MATVLATYVAGNAYALGFGRMRVQSALGQPLRVEVELTDARNGCPSADCTRRRPNPSAYALPATQVNNTVAIATLEIRKRINGVFPSAAVRLDLVQFFIAGYVVIANSWNLASCCQA